jgi:serine protease AprX
MRKGPLLARLTLALLLIAAAGPRTSAQFGLLNWLTKLDAPLQQRVSLLTGHSRVIVRTSNSGALGLLTPVLRLLGATIGRSLPIVNGIAADLPNTSLSLLAGNLLVEHISLDRTVTGAIDHTAATVGATAVHQQLGYDGAGIGVAIVDSGNSSTLDDLLDSNGSATRVDTFVDFVNGRQAPYDDYGHGTHVAGIVAGNGLDSGGGRTGIAPAAHIIALKALDGSGSGRISDVIAALDYAVAHRDALHIRVINLSVAAAVYESYELDPLTLAAKKAVDAGIVVVAAAGNNGRGPDGTPHYGGITAPGNAPWVLTVGASSHMGTADRSDDTMAAFSSRGPSAIDASVKPDLVAPGVGIESLSDPGSAFYTSKAPYLLTGTTTTSYLPYLSLSGTSMAAPVVSGTVALMLQANPEMTPDQVKAVLESTAQSYSGYDRLTQGAGFLDTLSAVELARSLVGEPASAYPSLPAWTDDPIWRQNGVFTNGGTIFGADDGDTVVWGTSDGDTVVWGTSCDDPSCEPVLWEQQ